MADPVTWADAIAVKYGPTVAGLLLGTAAKYGLTLSEGQRPTWTAIAADLLLLGMLGLLAIAISDAASRVVGLTVSSDVRVLIGSLAAVSSDRLVRLARDRFMKKVEAQLDTSMKASPATLVEIPAGPTAAPASTVKLTVFRSRDERAAPIERLSEGPLPKSAAEFDALIDKLK